MATTTHGTIPTVRGGPRLYIGNDFVLTEVILVVVMTVQRYRLDLVPGQTVKAHPNGTLRPSPGVWMMPHNTTSNAAI